MNQVIILAGILFNLIIRPSHVQCTPFVEPTNAVITKGDSVVISCSSKSSSDVNERCGRLSWKYFKPGASSGDYICMMAQLIPSVESYISVVNSSEGNCNLRINATSSAAGIYQCVHSSGAVDIELIVIEKGPQIAIQTSRNNVVTGLECSVHYSGNLVPKLQWMDLSGGNWTQADADDSETLKSYVSSTILSPKSTSIDFKETPQQFKCIVAISKPGKEDAPIYNWTSLIFGTAKIINTLQNKDESELIFAYSEDLSRGKISDILNLICKDSEETCKTRRSDSPNPAHRDPTSEGRGGPSSGHSNKKALASVLLISTFASVVLYF